MAMAVGSMHRPCSFRSCNSSSSSSGSSANAAISVARFRCSNLSLGKCSLRFDGRFHKRTAGGAAAALSQEDSNVEENDEEENEQDDYEQEQEQQQQQQQGGKGNPLQHLMSMKQRIVEARRAPNEQARARLYDIFSRLEELYVKENQEPTEGIKQLVALMEKVEAMEEPPPKFQVPQLVADALTLAVVIGIGFLVSHVNAVRDEKRFARLREQEELRRRTQAREPPKPPRPPTVVDKAVARVAGVVEDWQLRAAYLLRQRMELIVERIQSILLKLGWKKQ